VMKRTSLVLAATAVLVVAGTILVRAVPVSAGWAPWQIIASTKESVGTVTALTHVRRGDERGTYYGRIHCRDADQNDATSVKAIKVVMQFTIEHFAPRGTETKKYESGGEGPWSQGDSIVWTAKVHPPTDKSVKRVTAQAFGKCMYRFNGDKPVETGWTNPALVYESQEP
jgi:hypothetical protein